MAEVKLKEKQQLIPPLPQKLKITTKTQLQQPKSLERITSIYFSLDEIWKR